MTETNPHDHILQLLITGGFLDPGKLKEARDIIGKCAPSGSLEDAATEYAKDCVGEYDPELQDEFDDIKRHFLAGASHSFNKESFLKALREGNPWIGHGDYPMHEGWESCVNKAAELLKAKEEK